MHPANESIEHEPTDADSEAAGLSKGWFGFLLFCFLGLIGLTTVGALVRVTSLETEVQTREMIQDAEPLCDAIAAYTARSSQAPASLDLLVPEYIAELPPLRPEQDPGFEYQAGDGPLWTLKIWGGSFEYTRSSSEEKWFITGDNDETYSRDAWRPLH